MNKLQRIEEMEKQLAALKAEVSADAEKLKQADKWEPEGGEYFVSSDGDVWNWNDASIHTPLYKLFGVERKTQVLAEKAAKQMRLHNRILAYVHQYAPDWEADWSDNMQSKCYVFFSHRDKLAYYGSNGWLQDINMVYMPQHVAEQLVTDINSGRFDLEG